MTTASAAIPPGTLVSNPQDFPNVAVWRCAGEKGPVYRIAFDNLEFGGARRVFQFAATVLIALVIPLAIWSGVLAQGAGLHWLVGIGLFALLVIILSHLATSPGPVARVIELDFGNDRLRVLRRGRAEIERRRSRLKTLTVQDHPEAEFARAMRMEKGEKILKDVEKQHCLIGWFGEGGGEQVVLLCRAEWPNLNSLFEVQQAVLWAIGKATGRQAMEPQPPLNPPLD